jgi:hypothetical protein
VYATEAKEINAMTTDKTTSSIFIRIDIFFLVVICNFPFFLRRNNREAVNDVIR